MNIVLRDFLRFMALYLSAVLCIYLSCTIALYSYSHKHKDVTIYNIVHYEDGTSDTSIVNIVTPPAVIYNHTN